MIVMPERSLRVLRSRSVLIAGIWSRDAVVVGALHLIGALVKFWLLTTTVLVHR